MSQYGIIMPQAPAHFTHPRLQIRTAQDAHRIFEAVRLGQLPLIRRRLSPSERDLLASGQVFVWEEAPTGSAAGDEASQTTSGLERWTDGRRWSQSRMREPFLFYEEKIQTTPEERQAKADRRARKQHSQSGSPQPEASPTSQSGQTSDSQNGSSNTVLLPIRRQDRPTKPDGLTKQTYSSYVYSPSHPNRPPRKWHCVAYFSATDYNHLPPLDAYPELRNIAVPDGVYISAKGTGKTGAPVLMGVPVGTIPAVNGTGHSGSGLSPIGGHQSIVNGINGNGGGNGVGPIRRPVSRGEQSNSPYPHSKGRAESFGSSSDASSSSHLRSPVSSYSYDSPYDRHPPSSYHNPSPSPREGPEGYRYSGSTSSQSTGSGSPPTPGFMGPISNSASFVPSPHQQYSHQQHQSRPYDSHRSHRDRDVNWDKDTIMVDAPTLRTPTKEYPRHQQSNQGYFGDVYNSSHHSKRDRAGSSAGSTTPSSATTNGNGSGLPILPGIGSLTSAAGGPTRSKEDSKALGAFKISL